MCAVTRSRLPAPQRATKRRAANAIKARGALIPANLPMQVYLLKAIRLPSPARCGSVPSDAPRKWTRVSGAGRARWRRELCSRARAGRDAHAFLRGRGAVPQPRRLPSPRCQHLPATRLGRRPAMRTNCLLRRRRHERCQYIGNPRNSTRHAPQASAWTLSHTYNHGRNQATTYLPLLGLKKKVTVQFSQ